METSLYIEITAIFILLLANGFFALSEFSIIASRKSKLQQEINAGVRGAKTAKKLHNKPDIFLATIQIGITLMGTVAGVFGGATLVDKLQNYLVKIPLDAISDSARVIAVVIIAIIITVTAVVIGELVPKYIALSNPEKYARHIARPINIFIKIITPLALILSTTANFIARLLGIKKEPGRQVITEEEINQMILDGKKKGVFDATEEKLIRSVFDFADSTVRRAMTPRTDVVGIESNASSENITRLIIDEGYSRFPVYEGDLDNIIGILYTKDMIIQRTNPDLIILKDMIRKPTFVPDSMPLSKLLDEFQRKKYHIAVVLDEFGGTAGIITLEDILEELVGEIQDEYDAEQQPLVKHSETVAYADGQVWPGDVNKLMNSNLPEDQIDTMAGLIINTLDRLPENHEVIDIADMKITILEMDKNQLTRLKLEKKTNNTDQE